MSRTPCPRGGRTGPPGPRARSSPTSARKRVASSTNTASPLCTGHCSSRARPPAPPSPLNPQRSAASSDRPEGSLETRAQRGRLSQSHWGKPEILLRPGARAFLQELHDRSRGLPGRERENLHQMPLRRPRDEACRRWFLRTPRQEFTAEIELSLPAEELHLQTAARARGDHKSDHVAVGDESLGLQERPCSGVDRTGCVDEPDAVCPAVLIDKLGQSVLRSPGQVRDLVPRPS